LSSHFAWSKVVRVLQCLSELRSQRLAKAKFGINIVDTLNVCEV